ncbi:hypothetical protein DMI82_04065 [Blautia sp. BCRC 81119]|uniref:hypothetical protein n=1 Tax=Blautia sp. BCRC 81119 TaxID=2212480 RepID=UPI000D739AA5|nr:hypothetical protein [Blautia sp. BCRC 81119]PWY60504.1 hypothetical protein DMI82_04065 [Blautia sp. BCRC 81119]
MAKNILKKILTVIGYHSPDIARIVTIVMCIIMTGHWIAVNKDGMNVFIVLFSVLVIYPLLGLVLSVLIIIPSFICRMILYALGNDANAEDHYSYTYDNNSDSNNAYSNAENGYQRYQNQQQSGRYYGYSGYGYNSGNAGYGYSNTGTGQRDYSYNYSGRTNMKSDYEMALEFYKLQMPFTEKELKERRRQFMKTAHPDAGGSNEEAEKINEYYEILKKYAS